MKPIMDELFHPGATHPDGTVVCWTEGRYTYAAVMVGGTWYLTGGASYYGTDRMTQPQLVKVLLRGSMRTIRIATTWRDAVIAPDNIF